MLRTTLLAVTIVTAFASQAQDTVLHVYGPGGPAPAMKAAAKAYGASHGVQVEVTAGPTDAWAKDFEQNGELLYSGSEAMMSDFVNRFGANLIASSIEPLYLRPAAILVRPGNPKHIRGFNDLLKPGLKVMVVHGAGQVGMWEDIAGRDGKIKTIQALRHNIVFYAPNSAKAKEHWTEDKSVDAWIIYAIWAKANPGIAEVVELEPERRVYRDAGIALTEKGKMNSDAEGFVSYLKSDAGKKIFSEYGWTDDASKP